jgi:hypothetical protein
LKLLNDFLKNQGKAPATTAMFSAYYAEFDSNGDGKMSRKEIMHFVEKFLLVPTIKFVDIISLVNSIWYKFDTDRSGALNRKETLRFLNQFMADQKLPRVNNFIFNRFFIDFDINKDG